MSSETEIPEASLTVLLRSLRLPTFADVLEEITARAEQQGWSYNQHLRHLCEMEIADRRERRVQRLLKASGLIAGKTLSTLMVKKLPAKVARVLPGLCEGDFLTRAENILIFGLPGRGKSHLVCAIGHELVQRGHSVLFTPTYRLVQKLLAAKRDLLLDRELNRLDRFAAVILDDIGYVQQSRDEMEVLFTFLAQRYERRSVLITSNLVFSQWDRIFKDAMTTAAAVDRLVHHSTILELNGPSIRTEQAKNRRSEPTTSAE